MFENTSYFDRFWSVYPKRSGSAAKAMARVKFVRLVKSGVDPEIVIACARRYAEDNRGKVGTELIAMAQTWLNQRRFEDYEAETPKYTPEEIAKGREWYARKMAAANG